MDAQEQRSWWSRNWKWVVPAGCLTMLLLAVGGVVAVVVFIFGLMKSSDAYTGAVARAKAHPAVVAALGSPIEPGFFVTGNINISGGSGHANLAVPISGPKGSATLYVTASKAQGQWTFSALVVAIGDTGERIDLLESAATQPGQLPREAGEDAGP